MIMPSSNKLPVERRNKMLGRQSFLFESMLCTMEGYKGLYFDKPKVASCHVQPRHDSKGVKNSGSFTKKSSLPCQGVNQREKIDGIVPKNVFHYTASRLCNQQLVNLCTDMLAFPCGLSCNKVLSNIAILHLPKSQCQIPIGPVGTPNFVGRLNHICQFCTSVTDVKVDNNKRL
jgi:hypothetical protein